MSLADLTTILMAGSGHLDPTVGDGVFVDSLYEDGLKREADDAGAALCAGLLEDGALDRADMLPAFALSNEAADVYAVETGSALLLLA